MSSVVVTSNSPFASSRVDVLEMAMRHGFSRFSFAIFLVSNLNRVYSRGRNFPGW